MYTLLSWLASYTTNVEGRCNERQKRIPWDCWVSSAHNMYQPLAV